MNIPLKISQYLGQCIGKSVEGCVANSQHDMIPTELIWNQYDIMWGNVPLGLGMVMSEEHTQVARVALLAHSSANLVTGPLGALGPCGLREAHCASVSRYFEHYEAGLTLGDGHMPSRVSHCLRCCLTDSIDDWTRKLAACAPHGHRKASQWLAVKAAGLHQSLALASLVILRLKLAAFSSSDSRTRRLQDEGPLHNASIRMYTMNVHIWTCTIKLTLFSEMW